MAIVDVVPNDREFCGYVEQKLIASTFSCLPSHCAPLPMMFVMSDLYRFRTIWFAARKSTVEMDLSCRGMDILTLVIVMGQGVADIVVFGKPFSLREVVDLFTGFIETQYVPPTNDEFELIKSTRARYRREVEPWSPKSSSGV